MDIRLEKTQLRKELKGLRAALSEEYKLSASLKIIQELTKIAVTKQRIGVFYPLKNEVKIDLGFKKLHEQKKQLFLPEISKIEANKLLFFPFNPLQSYFPSQPHISTPIPVFTLDLIIVPLVGFDTQCYRLGMGGGFYDRLIADLKSAPQQPLLIGVAFECQRVARVPREPHDLPVHSVITEKQLY